MKQPELSPVWLMLCGTVCEPLSTVDAALQQSAELLATRRVPTHIPGNPVATLYDHVGTYVEKGCR